MDYLKNRLKERSTAFGLASLGVAALNIFFPQYAMLINSVAGALGVGVAALPTGGAAK